MFHRSRQSSREAMFYDTFLEPMPHQSGASCLSVPYVISGLGRFPHGISFLRPRLVSVVLLGAPSGPASQSFWLENRVPHVAVEHVFFGSIPSPRVGFRKRYSLSYLSALDGCTYRLMDLGRVAAAGVDAFEAVCRQGRSRTACLSSF